MTQGNPKKIGSLIRIQRCGTSQAKNPPCDLRSRDYICIGDVSSNGNHLLRKWDGDGMDPCCQPLTVTNKSVLRTMGFFPKASLVQVKPDNKYCSRYPLVN